jgi:hypothetical protein
VAYFAAPIIARMPALIASGSFGQAKTTVANSGADLERNVKQDAKTLSSLVVNCLS